MGLIRLTNKGVDGVDKVDEFHLLDPVEKMWWIRYAKLKEAWEELYPEREFPAEIDDGPILSKPWKDPFHPANDQLQKVQIEIEKEMVDWQRIQVNNGVIFCNFSDLEGCSDCRFRFKCEIKS
jgi:hypothetical protein